MNTFEIVENLEQIYDYLNCNNYKFDKEAIKSAIDVLTDGNTTFTIKCSMKDKWIDTFCSFLKYLENNGKIGRSEIVSFMSDGNRDFCPQFEFSREYNEIQPKHEIQDRKEVLPNNRTKIVKTIIPNVFDARVDY